MVVVVMLPWGMEVVVMFPWGMVVVVMGTNVNMFVCLCL